MLGPRFSLKSLFGAMAFSCLVLASLIQPWRGWRPAMVLTGVLVLMLLSIPAGIYARRQVRAYYIGFATVGWGYFLLAYSPWFAASVGRQLLAQPVAESVCFALTGSLGDVHDFLKVSHALFMLALAYLGGLISSRFYVQSAEQTPNCGRNHMGAPAAGEDSSMHAKELSLRRAQ